MSGGLLFFFGQTLKLHLKIGLFFFLFSVFFPKAKNLGFFDNLFFVVLFRVWRFCPEVKTIPLLNMRRRGVEVI